MAPEGTGLPGGRSAALLRDRRLLLILISGGVAAFVVTAVVGFSGAYFTSTSVSPGNQFAAAGVGLVLTQTGEVVNGSDMQPGDVRAGDQTVTVTGHRGAVVLVAMNLDTASQLTPVLKVRVDQTQPANPSALYDGPLASLSQVALGTFARDEKRTYKVTVTWPATQNQPHLQGTSASLDFDWRVEAVQ